MGLEAEATLDAATNIPSNTDTASPSPADNNPNPASENIDGDTPADTNKDDEHRVPKGVQKRIDRLTREKYRLQGELEALRRGNQSAPAPDQPAPEAKKAPKLDDFQTVEEYVAAMVNHNAELIVEKRLGERERSSKEQAQRDEQTKLVEKYGKQLEEARQAYDDYDDVVDNPDIAISEAMAKAIMRSSNGADIAYYLGKNPAEAERLVDLDPFTAAVEIGKISAKITRPSPKTATTAPAPIDPIGKRGSPNVDPDKMSTDEWLKWRNSTRRK